MISSKIIHNKKPKRAYFADLKVSNLTNDNISLFDQNNFHTIKCPKCHNKFVLKEDACNSDLYYICPKCKYKMTFIEFQKRYITYNWQYTLEHGFKLYSWDEKCQMCDSINPCISYCINQNVGTEELCLFEPLLLGSVNGLDRFIMWFCSSVNLFPNENNKLVPTIFCSKCDAPYSSDFFKQSFLNQKKLDLEYVIKGDVLKKLVNIKVEDITSLLGELKLLKE